MDCFAGLLAKTAGQSAGLPTEGCTSRVGTPQVLLRTVITRVPGLRPGRTSETSMPAAASRARVASASATRQLMPQAVWKRFSYPNNCGQPGVMDLDAIG